MRIGAHDLAQHVLIVAEIGANHEGDWGRAVELVAAAAEAGADAVKFQTYRAEKIVAASETDRRIHFRRLELSDDQFLSLAVEARSRGVMFLSTPFDLESADLLDPVMPAFKIASGDLTYVGLLRHIAAKGKPVILSTGMSSDSEIQAALATLAEAAPGRDLPEWIALLHCVSAYPTPPEQANLKSIPFLADTFGLITGYSDHTLENWACLAATALGARILEKHFTLDKHRSDFRDHALSAEPAEMAALVRGVRTIEAALGDYGKPIAPAERDNRVAMRRSLAARDDIQSGSRLTAESLTALRPARGLSPTQLDAVMGRRTGRLIKAGEPITEADLVG